jgi:hypothetical protein
MKKLGKLKLNQFSKAELENREMNALRGGDCTGCVCSCLPPDQPTADHNRDTRSNTANGPSSY